MLEIRIEKDKKKKECVNCVGKPGSSHIRIVISDCLQGPIATEKEKVRNQSFNI